MKKLLSLITLLILFCSTADAQDYSNLCTKYVPDKNFKGTLTSITGFNLLTKNIIEHQISKRLSRNRRQAAARRPRAASSTARRNPPQSSRPCARSRAAPGFRLFQKDQYPWITP